MTKTSDRPLALVTGASGGIGAAFAELLAQEGYDLVLVARSEEGLARVAESCRAGGAKVEILPFDLTAPESGEVVQNFVRAQGRPLTLLVNNAGFGLLAPVGASSLEEELGLIDLNVRVLSELCHRFLPDIKAQQGGIINVSSLIAYQPMPYFSLYAGSKAFVQTYSKMLAKEVAREGVRVLALCPGYTDTGFQSRAGAEVGGLDRFVPKHTPQQVAAIGWRAYGRGRQVKIVGFGNWLTARMGFLATPFLGIVSRKAYDLARRHAEKAKGP